MDTASEGCTYLWRAVTRNGATTLYIEPLPDLQYHATNPRARAEILKERRFRLDIKSDGTLRDELDILYAMKHEPCGLAVYLGDSPEAVTLTGRGNAIVEVEVRGSNFDLVGEGRLDIPVLQEYRSIAERWGFTSITYQGPFGINTAVFDPLYAIPLRAWTPVPSPTVARPPFAIVPPSFRQDENE